MSVFPAPSMEIPTISTEQMIEVDRAMIEDFGISLVQMMENAGRNLAHLARIRFLNGDPRGKRVVILAGTGGNGGGALACARRLNNWGAVTEVYLTKSSEKLTPVPRLQYAILRKKRVPLFPGQIPALTQKPDLVIDGIIGYSLSGAPRGVAAEMIHWTGQQQATVLSLDTPSGIDLSTGFIYDPSIKASATMTLALPKTGLLSPFTQANVGELYLADISVPPELYAIPSLGLEIGHLFAESEILRLA